MKEATNILYVTLSLLIIILGLTKLNSQPQFDILADCKGNDIEVTFEIPYAKLFYDMVQGIVIDTGSLVCANATHYFVTKRDSETSRYDRDIYKYKSFGEFADATKIPKATLYNTYKRAIRKIQKKIWPTKIRFS
jgi:hypothetical protein